MRCLQSDERTISPKGGAVDSRGLADWALKLVHSWRGLHHMQRRQMHLVETLALGGKRQLMLVCCDGEKFLVGGGSDSVETIVRVAADRSLEPAVKNADEICG
jgi:hypothetical protein